MSIGTYVLIGVTAFLCIFMLVDRICRCFERCATCKAYGEFLGARNKEDAIDILEKDNLK